MSFEGYTQLLCEDGHYCTADVYASHMKYCHCGKDFAWWNIVDTTNGSWQIHEDGTMERIDGFVELSVKETSKVCVCISCGNQHSKEEITYLIPENVGHIGKYND